MSNVNHTLPKQTGKIIFGGILGGHLVQGCVCVCVCIFPESWFPRKMLLIFVSCYIGGLDLLNLKLKGILAFSFISLMWSGMRSIVLQCYEKICSSLYAICSGMCSTVFISFTKWFVIPSP